LFIAGIFKLCSDDSICSDCLLVSGICFEDNLHTRHIMQTLHRTYLNSTAWRDWIVMIYLWRSRSWRHRGLGPLLALSVCSCVSSSAQRSEIEVLFQK
jgi:hypothetical protein